MIFQWAQFLKPRMANLAVFSCGATLVLAQGNAAFAANSPANRVLESAVLAAQKSQSATQNAKTQNVTKPRATPFRVAQKDAQLAAWEKEMAQLVNAARKTAKLPPLVFDASLAEVARAHSQEMRQKNYFAHESPTPNLRDPIDRYRAAFSQTPAVVAENIYREWGSPRVLTRESVRRSHNALMNSPHHRENIMNKNVRRIGVGFITNTNGDLWVTQMFSLPKWD